jgi:diamine N-acetyltransferase
VTPTDDAHAAWADGVLMTTPTHLRRDEEHAMSRDTTQHLAHADALVDEGAAGTDDRDGSGRDEVGQGASTTTDAAVTIRSGVAGDARVLATFGAATFRSTYLADAPREALDAFVDRVFGPAKQATELADPSCQFFLAELAGELVGYLLLRDGPRPASVPGDRPLTLDRLYVAPDSQGRGIGRSLLERAVAAATSRGHDLLWLTVWERNQRAIAAYRRWGFHEVGEVGFDLAGAAQTDRVMVLPCPRPAEGGPIA